MAGVLIIMALVGVGAFTMFALLWKFYWSPKKHWDELYEMLRKRGIGDRPENIVKSYNKLMNNNLTEKEVRKLTRQYLFSNKEFFLTMYDNIQQGRRNN